LAERLPEKLAEADAEADDGVTTPAPAEIHRSDVVGAGAYPALELIATGSTPQVNSASRVMRHRVIAAVTVAGDTEETLAMWLERYLWAIREVVRDQLFTPQCDNAGVDTGEEGYSPLGRQTEETEGPFVKGGWIELFVTTVE
jgi:hypothetical protein